MSDVFIDGIDTPDKAANLFRKTFQKYLDYIKYLKDRKTTGVKLSNREIDTLNKFDGIKKRIDSL